MITISRRFEWDAGHRVLRHEGKCKYVHGHRYVAEIVCTTPQMDELTRVIDFGVVKKILGTWIDDNWDHRLLLHCEDPLWSVPMILDEEPFNMGAQNPTAEAIAECLYLQAMKLLPSHIVIVRVRVYETPNCYAEYCRP